MIYTAPFKKALAALKRSLDQPKNEFTRNSTIQCFEFSYELAWKTLKRYLSEELNIESEVVKQLFRIAANKGLIKDPQPWFDFQKSRNLTSHTYNENTADLVYETAKLFYPEALSLLTKIEAGLSS